MRDAALRIHPRVARISVGYEPDTWVTVITGIEEETRYARFILLSFYLRMLARGAVADKGK